MPMSVKRNFWVLYLIFAALNLIDYYSTAIAFLLPGFEEQNPIVRAVLINGTGLFLDMKMSIILFAGVIGGLVYQTGKEEGLRQFNRGLIVLNAILAVVCIVNISQILYCMSI
jgi:hypothetical protein